MIFSCSIETTKVKKTLRLSNGYDLSSPTLKVVCKDARRLYFIVDSTLANLLQILEAPDAAMDNERAVLQGKFRTSLKEPRGNSIFKMLGGDAEDDIVELHGVGIVIDADRGLILTDRGTVPQRLADIEVSLNGESRSASVWHMHPEHSIVVLP